MHRSEKITDLALDAVGVVAAYVCQQLAKTDRPVKFSVNDVHVISFTKTLQNWKALVGTTLPDGMYYEVTYNGNKNEIYIDAYKKFDNYKLENFYEERPVV